MAVSDGTYQRREIVSALAAEKKTATRQKARAEQSDGSRVC